MCGVRLLGALIAWAILAPFWLLAVAALGWGRVVLTRNEIVKALAWTAVGTTVAFPVMWAWLSKVAQINPEPKSSAMLVGALFAASLLPVYSALAACVAFGLRIEAARKRGTPERPTTVRVLAGFVVLASVLVGLVLLGLGGMFAAGPKAMG